MRRVFFTLCLAAGFALPARAAVNAKIGAPPEGITPVNVTLSRILKRYDAAVGRLANSSTATQQETWSFTESGLRGTESIVRRGSDYRVHIVTGPLTEDFGQFLGHAWHRYPSGVVSPTTSSDYTSFEMLLLMQDMSKASDPKNDVTVLGEVKTPKPAYVLRIHRPGKKYADFAFYDESTGLIDRYDSVVDRRRITITYEDYRATKGLTQPWHVHLTDGLPALDDDFTRTSLVVGAPVDPQQFAMPPSTHGFVYYPGHASLPDKIYPYMFGPTLVVRLMVAGRGLDFAVSAGSPRSYIDFDVAQQLGLPSFGQTIRADGKAVPYDSILPQADVGPLLLRNWPILVTPFHYHLNDATKIVGVIGYDVLSSGVFKIDFDNEKLEVYPAHDFDAGLPKGTPPMYELPISFDDGLPFFSGEIDSHVTRSILFDNDSDISLIFGHFTNRYPDSVKDLETGKAHDTTFVPFADSRGFGRSVDVWAANVPELDFGPARFVNYHIIASNSSLDIGGREVDALMGGDLLQFYDIYLDYPHNRIFLRPNKSFFKVFQAKPAK